MLGPEEGRKLRVTLAGKIFETAQELDLELFSTAAQMC